jgi:mannose-6-phosphate isomerase-like protein (cupin superfamily)
MDDIPDTQFLGSALSVTAPDGSLVRPLCHITGLGSFAHFQLEPGEVAKAVSHATVQEIWYVVAGRGSMWRRQAGGEPSVSELRPGVCLTIPLRTSFQFRSDGDDPLQVVAVTMPPWPAGSENEARPEQGPWTPTL